MAEFKFVDRRRFTEEGADNEAAVTPAAAEPKPVETPISEPVGTRAPISFSLFIQSLAHQSLMALGLVPWPDSGLIKPDLQQAKETIDVLAMLKEKTKGNLQAQEQKLFDTLLYELQMTFVQVLKNDKTPPATHP